MFVVKWLWNFLAHSGNSVNHLRNTSNEVYWFTYRSDSMLLATALLLTLTVYWNSSSVWDSFTCHWAMDFLVDCEWADVNFCRAVEVDERSWKLMAQSLWSSSKSWSLFMEDCIRSYPKVDKQNILDKLFSRNVYFFLLIVKRAKSCKVTLRCSFLVIFLLLRSYCWLLSQESGYGFGDCLVRWSTVK